MTTLRTLTDSVLVRSPFQRLYKRRSRDHLLVLAYHEHGVLDRERFRDQMELLVRCRDPVVPDRLFDAGRDSQSKPAALVTFDDVGPAVVENAMPVLQDLGIPAVGFVIAGQFGSARPSWWVEVRELVDRANRQGGGRVDDPDTVIRRLKRVPDAERLAAIERLRERWGNPPVSQSHLDLATIEKLVRAGIVLGNHTMTHPCLDRCESEKVEEEIHQAHETLAQHAGVPPTLFAYPNGNYDARAESVLRRLGYEGAFLFDHALTENPPPNPFRVSRVRVSSQISLERFQLILSGLHPRLHRLLGRS